MSDEFKDQAEQYDALVGLERVFLENVQDDAIAADFIAARKGDDEAFKRLTELMLEGMRRAPEPRGLRAAKADKAIEILYMFRQSAH